MSIGIRKREDIRRWEVSRLDWKCWVFMDRKEVIIKVPFLLIISIHPWSTNFISVWVDFIGKKRIFCVVRGVKNHIDVIIYKFLIGRVLGREPTIKFWGDKDFVVKAQTVEIPRIVTVRARNFI